LSADAIKAIRNYWDRKAHVYAEVRQRRDWFQQVDKRVLDLVAPKSLLVLDVGTGPASFAIKLAKTGNITLIVGADISKRSLRIARTNIIKEKVSDKISLVVASADHLPFREASFDAVTSIFTIHHLPPLRMERSFGEFYMALKPKGKFALVEDWSSDPRTYFQNTIYELRRILMRNEVTEYHTQYLGYIRMLERNGLKIFDVEFHPNQVDLSRFASLSTVRARKLLKKVEKIDERQQVIDTTFIGAIKPT
jgi:ubiquinone/menaquinone biosynthesis C-methylase UbiE